MPQQKGGAQRLAAPVHRRIADVKLFGRLGQQAVEIKPLLIELRLAARRECKPCGPERLSLPLAEHTALFAALGEHAVICREQKEHFDIEKTGSRQIAEGDAVRIGRNLPDVNFSESALQHPRHVCAGQSLSRKYLPHLSQNALRLREDFRKFSGAGRLARRKKPLGGVLQLFFDRKLFHQPFEKCGDYRDICLPLRKSLPKRQEQIQHLLLKPVQCFQIGALQFLRTVRKRLPETLQMPDAGQSHIVFEQRCQFPLIRDQRIMQKAEKGARRKILPDAEQGGIQEFGQRIGAHRQIFIEMRGNPRRKQCLGKEFAEPLKIRNHNRNVAVAIALILHETENMSR